MSSKRKGKKGDTTDPNVPLLKPTVTGKTSGGSKPTSKTWKEWEEEDAREERSEKRSVEKQRKSRAQFAGLLRFVCVISALVITLSLQPFAVRPRAPGVNKLKAAPVTVLLAGARHFGARAGVAEVKVNATLDSVGRALLWPNKYTVLRRDKRASANDKTASAAWRKTKAALESALVNTDREVCTNDMMFVGSALVVLGALLAPLISGVEFAPLLGGLLIFNGGHSKGLEPQPELYTLVVLCGLALACGEAARSPAASKSAAKRKAKRS